MRGEFIFGSSKSGGRAGYLSRADMGRIIEAVRLAAETQREGTGRAPRSLNRIGAKLAHIAESSWENE